MSDAIARLNAALEGRYAIERELGEGGMATVYLADDLKHERKVALKVLKPELAAVVGAERFLAEITTTANLAHPHILPLHDSGEADSFLFYVMPYVEGETLRDRIDREKQLPVDEAVALASKVAGALQHAHEHGVIHRDIKPGNILLQDGEPVVSDFGIALAVGAGGVVEPEPQLALPEGCVVATMPSDRGTNMRPILSIAVLVLLALGCGGGSDPTAVNMPIDDDPAPPPTTNIIGADSFDVVPVEVRVFGDPNFLVEFAKRGVVPQGLVPSDGKLLVLSVKDLTDPELICETGNWGSTCASMILIEQEGLDPGRLPGRLELNTSGGRKIWFPQADTLTLAEAPPPG